VKIDQNAHQLGDGETRMVSLSCTATFAARPRICPSACQVTVDQILQRGRDKEIFLAQPQLAPRRALVVRIKEFANRFGARLLGAGAEIVAGVEDVEP